MDIRKPQQTSEQTQSNQQPTQETAKFKAGVLQTADAKLMLPPAIQGKLSALTAKYGIPFDLSNIGLDGKMAENVKALRTIVTMAEGDSKLLPEMLRLIKKLLKAEISLAKFHRGCVQASIQHQEKLDKVQADILLKMCGYEQRSKKLEHITALRQQLKEKRIAVYNNYYEQSCFGEQSRILDVEFEVLASNQKVLSESKQQRVKFEGEQKQKLQNYVNSAYQ